MDWGGEPTRLVQGVAESQTEDGFTAETKRTPEKASPSTAENTERAEFLETCFPLCSSVPPVVKG